MNEPPRKTPIDGLVGQTFTDFKAKRANAFEGQVVDHLFRHFRLPSQQKWQMLHAFAKRTGENRLTLAEFANAFAECPVYFVARVLPKVAVKSTVSKILSRFIDQDFGKTFLRLDDDVPEDILESKSLALVFPWPYLDAMALHNFPRDDEQSGVRIVWVGPRKHVLTMEPLANLLNAMGREWIDA